jgi:S1-C subfamily serine protease
VAEGSPARLADLREGDVITHVGSREVKSLAGFYQILWSLGTAGIAVPLTTLRGGTLLHLTLRSVDRTDLLKKPQAH